MTPDKTAVLNFWFNEISLEQKFKKDPTFDKLLESQFGSLVEQALQQKLANWQNEQRRHLGINFIARSIY